MKQIYAIQATMSIEFKDGSFTKWDEIPRVFYAYEKYKDAEESVFEERQLETNKYKEWLSDKEKRCFIHHNFSIENILLFENKEEF